MLADSQYDIKLAGMGYLLIEDSRRKRAQQAFYPRFSTGDYGLTDLSFWQWQGQEDFYGGEGQVYQFLNKAQYKQSAGWDTRFDKPRLGYGYSPLSLLATPPAPTTGTYTRVLEDFEHSPLTPKWAGDTGGWITTNVGSSNRGTMFVPNNPSTAVTCSYEVWTPQNYSAYGTFQWDVYGISMTTYFVQGGGSIFQSNVTWGIFKFIWKDANNYYYVKLFGTGMATITLHSVINGVDTTLLTVTGTSLSAGTASTIKVTRSGAGLFTLFQDGASLGTCTENTITVCNRFSMLPVNGYVAQNGNYDQVFAVDNIIVPSPTLSGSAGMQAKSVIYEDAIYFAYPASNSDFTFTQLAGVSLPSNVPTIYHCNAADLKTMSRDGEPTLPSSSASSKNRYLLAIKNNVLNIYDLGNTLVQTVNLTCYGTCILPISSTQVLIAGNTADRNGVPCLELVTFTAGAWTVASQKVLRLDGSTEGLVCSYAAIDASGTVYIATTDCFNNLGAIPSRLIRVVSSDLLATNPTVSAVDHIPNMRVRGVFSIAGTVYIFGALLDGPQAYNCIMKFNGGIVYKSTQPVMINPPTDGSQYNLGIQTVFPTQFGVSFLSANNLGVWDPVIELQNDGSLHEVAAFNSQWSAAAQPNPLSLCEWGGHFYLIQSVAQQVLRSGDTRGSFPADFADLRLNLSQMAGNTPLVQKALYSVLIQLDAPPPAGFPIYVDVNGTNVGSISNTDAVLVNGYYQKEIVVSAAIVGTFFEPVVRTSASSTWAGRLERLYCKYIPTQLKKRAFGIGVRATRALRLADGTYEQADSESLISQLWTAWQSNSPVDFVDVDGTDYQVVITDIDEREPLLNRDGTKLESLIFLELLEV